MNNTHQKSGKLTAYGLQKGIPEKDYIRSNGACITINISWNIVTKLYSLEAKVTLPTRLLNSYLLTSIVTDNYSEARLLKRWAKSLARHYVWNSEHFTNADSHFTRAMCAATVNYKDFIALVKHKLAPMAESYYFEEIINYGKTSYYKTL